MIHYIIASHFQDWGKWKLFIEQFFYHLMLPIYSLQVIHHVPWISSVKFPIYCCPGEFIQQRWHSGLYWLALEKDLLVFPEQLKQQKEKWRTEYSSSDLLLPLVASMTSLSCIMHTQWNSTTDFLWEEDEPKDRASTTCSKGLGLEISIGCTQMPQQKEEDHERPCSLLWQYN